MLRLVLRRLLRSVPVVVLASIAVFATVRASSDPLAVRAPGARIEDVARVREQLGLDEGPVQQYLRWAGHAVRGDLGTSVQTGRPVWPDLRAALWASVQLGAAGLLLALLGGVGLGLLGALRRGWPARLLSGSSLVALSIPTFVVAFVLQLVLVRWWRGWFGSTPFFTSRMSSPGQSGLVDRLRHLALPAVAVAVQGIAVYARHLRASLGDVLAEPWIEAARARGLGERRVVLTHALRSGLVPLTTVAALDAGVLIGGLVVTERVFQWPGMGTYFLRALADGDAVRVLPWAMVVVLGVVLANVLGEVLHGVLDPRVRAS